MKLWEETGSSKSDMERIRLCFPKAKQGEFTPKIIPVPPTYSKQKINKFVQSCTVNLLDYAEELITKATHFIMHPVKRPSVPKAPPKLTSQYEHPDKDTIPLLPCYNN